MLECAEDPRSRFSAKRFSAGGVRFERPLKTFDADRPPPDGGAEDGGGGGGGGPAVAEAALVVRSSAEIEEVLADAGGGLENPLLRRRAGPGVPYAVNITLDFGLADAEALGAAMWEGFFEAYCRSSPLFASVPSIGTSRYVGGRVRPAVDAGRYARFVDSAAGMLDGMFKGPVFVPVPLGLPLADISGMVEGYLAAGRRCLWLDFEGRAVGEAAVARVAHVLRILEAAEELPRSVLYYANVGREMLPYTGADRSPASDVLAPIAGADIVGLNRPQPLPLPCRSWGPAPGPGPDGGDRLLDPASYYYCAAPGDAGGAAGGCEARNAALLDAEFAAQADALLREGSIVPYVRGKEMLARYRGGDMLRALAPDGPSPGLDHYL